MVTKAVAASSPRLNLALYHDVLVPARSGADRTGPSSLTQAGDSTRLPWVSDSMGTTSKKALFFGD